MAKADVTGYSAKRYPINNITDIKIGIVRTEWNNIIVDSLEDSCLSSFKKTNLPDENISIYRVPGSFELPQGVKYILGASTKYDAIICLGCVIQGETKHDDYINHTVTRSINQIGLISGIPVIFGVLTVNTLEQAKERSGGSHGDKGKECAYAALKMISLKQSLRDPAKKISF